VHEGVAAEDEGVIVDADDGRAGGGADMRETDAGFGVGADAAEVEVVDGWGGGFVAGWAEAVFGSAVIGFAGRALFEVGVGACVPGYACAVDVIDAVACAEERIVV